MSQFLEGVQFLPQFYVTITLGGGVIPCLINVLNITVFLLNPSLRESCLTRYETLMPGFV